MAFKFTKKILAFILIAAVLTVGAVAVISYADFQDGTTSKTIGKSDTATFDVGLFSVNPPITYSIKMYNPNGDLAKTWYDHEVNTDGFVELLGLTVTPEDITVGGEYTIMVNSVDGNGDTSATPLTINVYNNVPIIVYIQAPEEITAGEILHVDFDAYDPDDDVLGFKIYRNGAVVSNLDHDNWQTDENDAGTYAYKFEVTDGEATVSETRTVVVKSITIPGNDTDTKIGDVSRKLNFGNDIGIEQVGDYIMVRNNKGVKLNDFEMTILYTETGQAENHEFNLGRNDVVYEEIMTQLPENKSYIASVEIKARGMEASGYMLIDK